MGIMIRKNMRCFICKKPLFPYSKLKVSKHHIDYVKNIYIKVCRKCHSELHNIVLCYHEFGVANLIWKCDKCSKINKGYFRYYGCCSNCSYRQHIKMGKNGLLYKGQRISKIRKDYKGKI